MSAFFAESKRMIASVLLALPLVLSGCATRSVVGDATQKTVASSSACPRIVSQSPYLTLALEWLDRGECIVGLSRYDRAFPALPRTGGVLDPDQAAIAALYPDLIVSSNWADQETMKAVTPEGARLLRLDGFGSMNDAEEMLRTLALESGASAATREKITDFSRQWRSIAQKLSQRQREHRQRALLVSTCMGNPFSFGRQHLIGDIFAQAGFEIVETAPKVRHLVNGQDIPDLETLIDKTRPDIIVAFSNESAEYCRMIAPRAKANVIILDGAPFIHPGPGLLQAYESIQKAFD
ncbi:MAG: ABC transporter substrate-binding protein [Azoarcus sp.]|jgi:iron complex transport system substrate-binding protein|nr:ABC transporter substrate-binding protein [Azoarcus sp.]